jgi:hypothetical protein
VLENLLRSLEVRARDFKTPLVELLLGPDRIELDVRRVVGLDRMLEVRVDRLDLGEDVLRFRLLLGDR